MNVTVNEHITDAHKVIQKQNDTVIPVTKVHVYVQLIIKKI